MTKTATHCWSVWGPAHIQIFQEKNPRLFQWQKKKLDTKTWRDTWRMTSRINLRKLAWGVHNLSTPPSTVAESSTFRLSCLHTPKWRQQWLHGAAGHSGHESWPTPRDLFREEIWMLLWAAVWSGNTDSNNWAEENASKMLFFLPSKYKDALSSWADKYKHVCTEQRVSFVFIFFVFAELTILWSHPNFPKAPHCEKRKGKALQPSSSHYSQSRDSRLCSYWAAQEKWNRQKNWGKQKMVGC